MHTSAAPPLKVEILEVATEPETASKTLSEQFAALNINAVLETSKVTDLTQPGQFGYSYKITFSGLTNEPLFLKLPPRPEDVRLAPEKVTPSAHYEEMRKRFTAEFNKNKAFSHIIDNCTETFRDSDVKFTIACPLARVELLSSSSNQRVPGLLYEFKGNDVIRDDTDFRAGTARDFFQFAVGLARLTQIIHNQGILHSFLVPRNLLRCAQENTYAVVGFGYSNFCDTKPHTPYMTVSESDRPFRSPECMETESLGSLWYPADIYSIGAILFAYATGDTLPLPIPKDIERLKKKIYDKFNPVDPDSKSENSTTLFLQNENLIKIIDKCLRYAPEDRFSCAEELLEGLEVAISAGYVDLNDEKKSNTHIASPPTKPKTAKRSASSGTQINEDQGTLGSLFGGLYNNRLKLLCEDLKKMEQGHYEVFGHRDVLVSSLCRMIAGAQPGDLYRTMTMPSYWTDENLGMNGRFLTMNKHMARRGLRIERLFLVTQDFHELSELEQDILEAQRVAQKDVQSFLESRENRARGKNPSADGIGSFDIKVRKLSDAQKLVRFETDSTQVAYLESKSQSPEIERLCLNFISQGRYAWLNGTQVVERWIKKIRYWTPSPESPHRFTAFKESVKMFTSFWESGALTLDDYMGKHPGDIHLDDLLS